MRLARVFLLSLFVPTVVAADGPATGSVTAPAPGLYRIRLGGEILARHAGGWAVRDDRNEPVPHHMIISAPGGERAIQVVDMNEDPAGWTLTLDTGEPLAMHDRVRLRPSAPVLAAHCALEFGDTPAQFTPGGEGRIFSMGKSGNLQKAEISYAVTARRYLRIHWPKAAGFPNFENATVDGPPYDAGERREPLQIGAGEVFIGGKAWALAPGSLIPHARGLYINISDCIGWRWLAGRAGVWRSLGNGVCPSGELHLPVGSLDAGDALRLELYGTAPAIRSVELAWPVVELWLLATRAGTLRISPRDQLRPDYPLPEEAVGRVPLAELPLRLDAAEVSPPPDLAPFRPLSEALDWSPETRWPLKTSAGAWNELILPAEDTPDAGRAAGYFLLAGEDPVPFELSLLASPALVIEAGNLTPQLVEGLYRIEIPVRGADAAGAHIAGTLSTQQNAPAAHPKGTLSAYQNTPAAIFSLPTSCVDLELTVPATDFSRDVVFSFSENRRAGLETQAPRQARDEWECAGEDGVCALSRRICPGAQASAVIIEIASHNQPQLPPLRIAAWQPVSVLHFFSPDGPVTLAHDPSQRVGEFPDFEQARHRMAGLPVAPATIAGPPVARAPGHAARQKWLLLAGLAITGVLLLVVVIRLLPAIRSAT